MPLHEPTQMKYAGRSNRKHTHNTRHGRRERNHWFNVYECPVCKRRASHRRKYVCKGFDETACILSKS